jgi:hypothetical protein
MSKQMWAIRPLIGKYYGTIVCFDHERVFTIWEPDHFATPFASEREILGGWTPEDGHDHVEDQQSYKLACELVDHLNSIGFEIK